MIPKPPPFFTQNENAGQFGDNGPLGAAFAGTEENDVFAIIMAASPLTSASGLPAYPFQTVKWGADGTYSADAYGIATSIGWTPPTTCQGTGYAYDLSKRVTAGVGNLPIGLLIKVTPMANSLDAAGRIQWQFGDSVGINSLRVLGRTGDLSPVTKLTVNNAVLTGTAANAILTPDVATGSLSGIVSLSDQVMGAGEKTFEYILLSEADSYVDMGSGTNTVIDAAGSNSIVCIAGSHAMNLGASYADVGVQPQAKLNFYGSGGADELDGWIDCFEDETNRYMELRIVDDAGVRINSLILNASGASLFAGTFSIGANVDVTGSFTLSGDVSPAQLTAQTDNWNPTGWN